MLGLRLYMRRCSLRAPGDSSSRSPGWPPERLRRYEDVVVSSSPGRRMGVAAAAAATLALVGAAALVGSIAGRGPAAAEDRDVSVLTAACSPSGSNCLKTECCSEPGMQCYKQDTHTLARAWGVAHGFGRAEAPPPG